MGDFEVEGADAVTRRSIIIIEDNFAVADSLRWLVEAVGHEVVGLAGTLERGLELIDEVAFDAAILDVDLHGANVTPLARRLVERSKGFLFLTGYADADVLPPDLAGVLRLEKPADPKRVIAAIDSITSSD